MTGPYETEDQAVADVRDVYELIRTGPKPGAMREANELRLLAACRDRHVKLGAHDRRIVHWLAGYEPETVQVVVGWLRRAA